MQIIDTTLPDVLLIKPDIHIDNRGYLYESYRADKYLEISPDLHFAQENISVSNKNVLRGLHFQRKRPQGKLIQVLQGEIFDVVVDIRPRSEYFGSYFSVSLSAENHMQLWIPPGYAHGFCALIDTTVVQYKCTSYYDPLDEAGIAWNCPDINIDWPINNPVLSDKDGKHPGLQQYLASVNQ